MPANRDRDCPLCGTETVVDEEGRPVGDDRKMRRCPNDDCLWCVEISGGGSRRLA